MSLPVPLPRSSERSKIPVPTERKSEASDDAKIGSRILHLAEVHNVNSDNRNETSGDGSDRGSGKNEKRRKKVRKRGTFLVKKRSVKEKEETDSAYKESAVFKVPAVPERRGSATETLSESSNKEEENRIKLKPLALAPRLKKPSGYATETLSEDSTPHNSPTRISSAPLPRPRQNLAIPRALTSPETSTETFALSINALLTSPKPLVIAKSSNNAKPNRRSLERIDQLFNESICEPVGASLNREWIERSSPSGEPFESTKEETLTTQIPSCNASLSDPVAPESPMNYYTSSSVDYKDTGVIPPPRMKRSKKKRKIKEDNDSSDKGSGTSLTTEEEPEEGLLPDKDTAVCITVHCCEPLRMKDVLKRPAVQVHLMDLNTKNYRRSAFGKNYVDAVRTQSFDHIQHRSVIPTWDEDLILLEPASHVVASECVFILELIELETEEILAWAFLKPMAANGKQNTGSVLRLQLFKPIKSRHPKPDDTLPLAFLWYLKNKTTIYRSTMLVSVHSIDSNLVIKPLKSVITTLAKGKSETRRRSSQMSSSAINVKLSDAEKELIGVVWSRIATLSCKLPNRVNASLPAGPDGGMTVSYSKSGLLIACHTSNSITVFTYRGSCYLVLCGHQGLVYDLSWSPDDSFLLSSSADTTACIWNIKLRLTTPVAVLSHPSYVYCCTWLGSTLAVTGCYDKILRLWDLSSVPTLEPQPSKFASTASLLYDPTAHIPLQCISAHKARINTVAPLNSEEILVSGDGDGVLVLWRWSATQSRELEVSREVALRELRGQAINKVSCHPGGKRILVALRDSKLRMVDVKSTSIIQWFHGNVNNKLQSGSCFCGCGSKVLACSEDGTVSVWEANTGEKVAVYKALYLPDSPASVAFHPKDNMFAVVSHKTGAFPSLVLMVFDRNPLTDVTIEYLDNRCETERFENSSLSDLSLRSSREAISTHNAPRKKKRGILRSLLQGGVKSRHKNGYTNDSYANTELGSLGVLELNHNERQKRASCDILGALDGDDEINHRLTDIIRRMDVLLTTSSTNHPPV